MTSVHTIISGAQTGSDRGGLDAAIILGLKRGGWAPLGWRSEDGEIPQKYRAGMCESASPAYPVRTRANVEASTGTLILSLGPLRYDSGSMLTAQIARRVGKPHLHAIIPVDGGLDSFLLEHLKGWLVAKHVRTLNVAGPRESREPGVQNAVCCALIQLLGDDPGFGWDPS